MLYRLKKTIKQFGTYLISLTRNRKYLANSDMQHKYTQEGNVSYRSKKYQATRQPNEKIYFLGFAKTNEARSREMRCAMEMR